MFDAIRVLFGTHLKDHGSEQIPDTMIRLDMNTFLVVE